MGGQSQLNKTLTANADADRAAAVKQQEILNQPTAGEKRFEEGASAFNSWLGKKDYSAAPNESSILNEDLWTPAHIQAQRQKLGHIQGVGSANMGGTGNESVALQLSRERNANQAAEDSGHAWEDAVKGQDNYYKSGDVTYSNMDTQRHMGLLGNASSSYSNNMQGAIQTKPQSAWEIMGPLFGAALGAAGTAIGGFGAGRK